MNDKSAERTGRIIALLQEKVRLEPLHRRLFYLAFGVVWGSGALWVLIECFKDPELGSARTLLQTLGMKVHGAAMLVFLAMLGTLLAHVRRGWILKANRLSGSFNIGINALLAITGWLLYYLSDDAAREWTSLIHWSIGLGGLPLLYAHIYLGRAWAKRSQDAEEAGPRSSRRAKDTAQ
jgi:hypothetical protein